MTVELLTEAENQGQSLGESHHQRIPTADTCRHYRAKLEISKIPLNTAVTALSEKGKAEAGSAFSASLETTP